MALSEDTSPLVNETNAFIDAVELKKPILDAAVTTANISASTAVTYIGSANTSAINASMSSDIARVQAIETEAILNNTRLQQEAVSQSERYASLAASLASSASTIVQQDLSGLNAIALHRSPNAITSLFVYDTSKDSDGGAWTEKCQHTSWYNETLSGKWLGPQPSEFNARYQGATLGSNILTNGDFSNGVTSWSAVGSSVTFDGVIDGRAKITIASNFGAGSGNGIRQTVTTVIGKTYRVTASVESIGAGSIDIYTLAGTAVVSPTSRGGIIECIFIAAAVTTEIRIGFNGTGEVIGDVGYIDNVFVREITAATTASNDYFQLTTDGKFYRLWKNLFQRSEEFDNTIWEIENDILIANTNETIAPDGTNTAEKMSELTNTNNHFIRRRSQVSSIVGAVYTLSVYAKKGTRDFLSMSDDGSRRSWFNIASGTVGTVNAGHTAAITSVGNGWYRCSITFTAITAALQPYFYTNITNNQATYTGSTSDYTYIWGAQLEFGSVATAYEAKGSEGFTSEVFRGNKADFPRLAGIVSEGANVNIYDLTEPGRPMWMRFTNGTNTFLGWSSASATTSSVAALSGQITIGTSSHGHILNFSNDDASIAYAGTFYEHINRRISARQANGGFRITTPGFGYNIGSNGTVNAVAMTVLPDAPTDPVTGLKIPTIALGTNGGMSVIQDKGTTRNAVLSNVVSIAISPSAIYAGRTDGVLYYANNPGTLGDNFAYIARNVTDAPGFAIGGVGNSKVVTSPRSGLFRSTSSYSRIQMIYRNTIDIARSIIMTITNTFNTGWTVGDVRRSYLSDTITLPATETELIAYPDMSAVNVGWTENRGGTLVYDGDGLLVTNTSAFGGGLVIPLTLYNGDALRITMDIEASGTGGIYGGGVVSGFVFYNTVVGRTQITLDTILTFTTPAVMFFIINAGQTLRVRYLSIKRLSPDRSHKKALASIAGTLTRTQVASGTSLIGYSGFSAANYIREPFSADLDFGTGEWNTSAWVNIPVAMPSTSFPVGQNIITNFDTQIVPRNVNSTLVSRTSTSITVQSVASGTFGISVSGITAVIGKTYKLTLTLTANPSRNITIGVGNNFVNVAPAANTPITTTLFLAANTTNAFDSFISASGAGEVLTISNISIQEASPALIIDRAYTSGTKINLGVIGSGQLTATAFDGTTTRSVTTTLAYNTAQWLKAEANYTTDGTLAIVVNGREVATTRGTPLLSLNSRYNLLTWSEDLSNATFWGRTTSTITGAQPDRDGGNTAFVYEVTSITNPFIRQTISANTTGTYTFTIYAKYFNARWIILYFNGINASAWFDVENGVTGGFTGADYISHNMTSAGNGYWRLSLTVNVVTPITIYPSLRPVNIDVSSATTIGLKVYLEDGQLELGSIAKTYQRVTTVAETNVAPLTIGNSYALDAPFPGSITMLKMGATVPTPEQATFMYEQEKQLFRTNAVSVLPDGNYVIDMTYDDATNRWAAISSTNESYWTGLIRNSVTPVPGGSYSKIATTSGIELTSRITTNPGVDISIPTYMLREDLNKRAESVSKLSKELVCFDYVGGFTATTTIGSAALTSVASLTYPTSYIGARISGTGIPTNAYIIGVSGTTIYISTVATATATAVSISFLDFVLPSGFETETIASAGLLRREGSTLDYTRFFDGFIEIIRFTVAPGATTWVQIQASKPIT